VPEGLLFLYEEGLFILPMRQIEKMAG